MADFLRSSNKRSERENLDARPGSQVWLDASNEIVDPETALSVPDPFARLRSIVEHAPDGILTLDGSQQITSCNTTLCRMLGYSLRDVLGNTIRHYLQPGQAEDPTAWLEASSKPHLGQYPSNLFAGEGLRSDGTFFPVEISVTQIGVESNLERLCIVRDATAHRAAITELQTSLHAAQRTAQARSDYLAQMSHEIRTPMNGILGMTALVLESELDAEQREFLEIAHGAAKSLLDIVDDVLDFSKIGSGGVSLNPRATDLRRLVEHVVLSLSTQAREKGLTVTQYVHDDVPAFVSMDGPRLRQVLINLLGNALKFTQMGTCAIEISCRAFSTDRVRLHFRVSDTGCGIDAAALPTLFDQFTQVRVPGEVHPGGTGLGLAISRTLVNLMGGILEVESAPGKGSTFYFSTASVPIAESADGMAVGGCDSLLPAPPTAPQRILLVEDNRVNELVACNYLTRKGHQVEAVNSGPAALAALRAASFDMVLMDIEMPNMDGIETLRQIRQGRGGADAATIPVIALTAHTIEEDRDRLLGAGMSDYVSKPIDDALLSAIARVVQDVLPTDGPPVTPSLTPDEMRNAQRRFLCSSQAYLNGILAFVNEENDGQHCDDLIALANLANEVDAADVVRAVHRIESAIYHGRYRRAHGLIVELADTVKIVQQQLRTALVH